MAQKKEKKYYAGSLADTPKERTDSSKEKEAAAADPVHPKSFKIKDSRLRVADRRPGAAKWQRKCAQSAS